jgi:hypothetical protein
MFEKLKQLNRIHLIMGAIILMTIPCYCLGFLLLWNIKQERVESTPSASPTVEETKAPLITATYTVQSATATITLTPTLTATFTPTITYVLPPTRTLSPTPAPTETVTPSPTATEIPLPSPTSTPTEVLVNTLIPSETP